MIWVRWSVRLFALVVFAANLWEHIATLGGKPDEWRQAQFFACFAAIAASSWAFLPGLRVMKSPPMLLLLVIGSGIVFTTGYGCITQTASGTLFGSGVPAGEEGDRYLQSHGKRLRDISEQEYQRAKLNDARQWSAANAMFSFLAVVISVVPLRPKASPPPPLADTPPEPSLEPVPPAE